jgi:hypothetical protein
MKKGMLWVGMLWLSVASYALAAEPAETAQIKVQIVKLLATVTMKLNHAVDEKFCRQFFEHFQKQEKIVHVQPIVQVDSYNDPALAPFKVKCPKLRVAKRESNESSDLEFELNETVGDQFGNLWRGTAHFRMYKVDINNDKADGEEHVFYSDRFVPKSMFGDEGVSGPGLDETNGQYLVVDFENCVTMGGVSVDQFRGFQKTTKMPGYNGIIQYNGRFYVYDLYPGGGYKLYVEELTNRRKTFETTCRYWQ